MMVDVGGKTAVSLLIRWPSGYPTPWHTLVALTEHMKLEGENGREGIWKKLEGEDSGVDLKTHYTYKHDILKQ